MNNERKTKIILYKIKGLEELVTPLYIGTNITFLNFFSCKIWDIQKNVSILSN